MINKNKLFFKINKYIYYSTFFLLTNFIYADVPEKQKHEVEHLLNFVKNSPCVINRNGTDYNGVDALAHIQKKYDYFKDKISTTEQFIEYSATKSTMSDQHYTVKCKNNAPIKTRDWLLNELNTYRKSIKH
ncbi:MAG: DUF5329 domain-containing protein [Spirochaetia bacterium]|nr:DUF5329 domain-containing protein [Spirochaetia bacterium]